MSRALKIVVMIIWIFGGTSFAHAQAAKLKTLQVDANQGTTTAAPQAATSAQAPPTFSSKLAVTAVTTGEIDLRWSPVDSLGATVSHYDIIRCESENCKLDSSSHINHDPLKATDGAYRDTGRKMETYYTYQVVATLSDGKKLYSAEVVTVKTARYTSLSCAIFPTRSACMDYGEGLYTNINNYFQTANSLSYFNQVKSVYNSASGSATASVDVATLNFDRGIQLTATTNAQLGSSGNGATGTGSNPPMLSAAGAGQAAQNLLFGGTVLASELYPLLAKGTNRLNSVGNFGLEINAIAKQGFDLQNFKSDANVNVTSPPFHGSAHIEGYAQYNSINVDSKTNDFVGAVFVGGSYGYNYMSHGYARDYGFESKVNNRIGQVSVGIVIKTVARVTVSRAFGPSQTYIDSTTMLKTTVNNFKAWSFGIAYQSSPPSK
jgi:hypothetical protein